ncbi:hypothetical protein, partial [Aquabacterium sp.]|uniref:hypothetical protein n=1 Tax=Aquabacterium sp. TaxID=1872578 RepID=UPI00260209C3
MYQPRPRGEHVTGGELTAEDSAAIELLARRLTNIKQASGLSSLRMVRALPDGGYAIAQDMGGVFSVQAFKTQESASSEPEFDGLAKSHVPALFSGVVTKALVDDAEGAGIKLTEAARRRLSGYDAKQEDMPPKDVALQRFRIGYNSMVGEFRPKYASRLAHTQYAQQRPTWYSGAMAEVMQIVGGYGRQDLDRLPKAFPERARMRLPEATLAKIKVALNGVRLPGYTGFPPASGQFQYDYKFANTHGVAFDSSRKPWLLCVRTDGVWAMPLPMVPATTTAAFRKYIESVGDDEILSILDRFGGMPSGEPFPSVHFMAWKRAGVVVKVAEVGDFYSHMAYSSACGWSFNLDGTEGFNTCYDYGDDGIGFGLAYKMKISLQPAEHDGRLPVFDTSEMDPDTAGRLSAYLSGLYSNLSNASQAHLAIKYKLRRVTREQILQRASRAGGGASGPAEVEYWHALELPPIAGHSGSVVQVGRGYLYSAGHPRFQPQIKFPEPLVGGCISYDLGPLKPVTKAPRCDTIMFGYYIGDELKVVKYCLDERTAKEDVQNNYEDCMIVGSWWQTKTTGSSSLMGNFYMSDLDARRVMAPSVEKTKIVGKDLGYDHTPWFQFDYPFWMPGTLWRNRYFSTQTEVDMVNGQSLKIGVCIPYYARNAAVYATKSTDLGKINTQNSGLNHIRDPYSYRFWTYDDLMHWAGGNEGMPGSPFPKDASPVWVGRERYDAGVCSDFADQGTWVDIPANYGGLIHP